MLIEYLGRAPLLAVIMLICICAATTAAAPLQAELPRVDWPEGWSRPAEVLTIQRGWGSLVMQRAGDHLVAVGAQDGDLLSVVRLNLSGEILSEATWTIPVEGHLLSHLRIMVDGDGAVHIVWKERGPGSTAIRYARLDEDFTVEIAGSVAASSSRVLGMGNPALDAGGRPVLLWSESVDGPEDIFLGEVDTEGRVTDPVILTDSPYRDTRPVAAVHPDGPIHVT